MWSSGQVEAGGSRPLGLNMKQICVCRSLFWKKGFWIVWYRKSKEGPEMVTFSLWKRYCMCCPEKELRVLPWKGIAVLPWKGIACAQSRTPLMIHLYIYINKYNVVAKHDKEKGYLYVWNSMLLILLNIWTAPVCDTYIFAWGEKVGEMVWRFFAVVVWTFTYF